MPTLSRVLRELWGLLRTAEDWRKQALAIIGAAIVLAGPVAVKFFKDEATRMPALEYWPYFSVAIASILLTLAFVRAIGPEVEMSDLIFDAFALDLGVYLTNNGRTKINPRLSLRSITTAGFWKRPLLRQSRPVLWNGVQQVAFPALSMHKESAFVPLFKKCTNQSGAFLAICVAPVSPESGPPVAINLLAPLSNKIALLVTFSADCGETNDGNVVHQTYRVEPTEDGSTYRITRQSFPFARAKRLVLTTPIPASTADKFAGNCGMVPEGREVEFFMTLNGDKTATRSHKGRPDANGTWTLAGDEVRVVWEDEWKDILRPDGNGVRKLAFQKERTFKDEPTNSQPAEKIPERAAKVA